MERERPEWHVFCVEKKKKIQGLRLRKAEFVDAKQLFEWKNDSECVRNSITRKLVEWEEHCAWFASVMQRDDVEIFILETDDMPLGRVRLDLEDEYGVISYSIAREYRGRQLGREILTLVEEKALQMGLKELRAVVQRYNLPSRKLFLQLGYTEDLQGNSVLYNKRL